MFSIITLALAAPFASASTEVTPEVYNLIMAVQEDSQQYVSLRGKSPITIKIGGFIQTSYVYGNGGDTEARSGFQVQRARLIASGAVYDFNYLLSGEWDTGVSVFELKDAAVMTTFNDFGVKAGQFVTSFYSGWVTNPTTLVDGEYTISALTFGQGRSQGIEFNRTFGDFRAFVSYNDGFYSANGPKTMARGQYPIRPMGNPTEYGISARLEYDMSEDFTFGGAFAYQDQTVDNYSTYTVDMTYKFDKFDFNAAYVSANWGDSWNNYSVVGTASYEVTDSIQAFAQYEYGVIENADSNLNVGTVGFNYIFNSNVRWTNSVGYAFNGISNEFDVGEIGWDNSSTDGQYLIRSMVQISF